MPTHLPSTSQKSYKPKFQSGERAMNVLRITAIALIIAGCLGLAYGGFSYTKDRHESNIGGLELSFNEKEYVDVPIWAGAGAIVLGVLLLLARGKRIKGL
jgi:TRAP-type C4-dicarboxylate transport system permease small subunit